MRYLACVLVALITPAGYAVLRLQKARYARQRRRAHR